MTETETLQPPKKNRPVAKTSRFPSSEPAKRIAAIFHRKISTAWNEKEIKQFRVLVADKCFSDLADLEVMERYYFAQRKMGERGVHRRDLITLLNNWQGELDRATEWAERHPLKPAPRKVIPMPTFPSEPFLPPTDPEELAALERFNEQRRLRKHNGATA